MQFTSVSFLCFFLPVVLLLHSVLRGTLRDMMLLAASLVFYAWGGPKHLILLVLSSVLNWAIALFLANRKRNKLWLFVGVSANVALLVYFKYFNMLVQLLRSFGAKIGFAEVAIPAGVSFFTFQAISYLVDVYRQVAVPQRNLLRFLLYMAVFPQLLSGPIVRYSSVEQQLSERSVSAADMAYGIKRFIYGLTKKLFFAGGFGSVADAIFGFQPQQLTTSAAWLGAFAYALQLYYDFSGYSDMAVGLGRMLGFRFFENFDYPYISVTVTEFWRRWHMTLSSWFRDYLYIPLGGNRCGQVRTLLNLLIVFAATGIWHGDELQFIVWGLWHGVFLIVERMLGVKTWEPKKGKKYLARVYCLLVVLFGWVLFRAPSLSYAVGFIGRMLIPVFQDVPCTAIRYLDGRTVLLFVLGVLLCGPLQKNSKKLLAAVRDEDKLGWIQIIWLGLLYAYSVVLLISNTYNPFIYAQF